MKKFWLAGLLMLLGASPLAAEYAVGTEPPDFSCEDTYGNPWSLYAQRGKVVLINCGATW